MTWIEADDQTWINRDTIEMVRLVTGKDNGWWIELGTRNGMVGLERRYESREDAAYAAKIVMGFSSAELGFP